MAFWGIEVKPGEPYTHLYDSARGRLRICQATLGSGNSSAASSASSASRSVVQCRAGDNGPVLLCSLIPERAETCQLELEFEEDDAVVFSVLGQNSVHLSGYYVRSAGHILDDGDELDSYGEDIGCSDTSRSSDSSEYEDECDSDFIDDGDNAIFPHYRHRKSGVVIEEIIEDEKPSTGNAGRRRLKKKYQMTDSSSDDDSKCELVVKQNSPSIFESEDEDGFPISMHSRKRNPAKGPEGNSKLDDMAVDEDEKQKINVISQDGETAGEPAEIGVEKDEKLKRKRKKKKKKKGRKSETDAVGPVKQTVEHVKEKANEQGKLPTENAQENSAKSRKKNKKRKRRDGNPEGTEKNADAMELQKSNAVEQLSNMSPGVDADKTTPDEHKDAKGKRKKKRKKNIVKDSVSNQHTKLRGEKRRK